MRLRAKPTNQVSPTLADPAKHEGRIGEILVRRGSLKESDIPAVLKAQQERGLSFGQAARHLGLVDDTAVAAAVAQQFRFDVLRPGDPRVAPSVLAAFEPEHPTVQRMRALRSQLHLRWPEDETLGRAFTIVSPSAGEGKSFIASNLAVVFAQLGARTLLIDADLRSPVQHQLFRVPNRIGLSTIIAGRGSDEPVGRPTAIANLTLIPSGPQPPNPEELLSQEYFEQLIHDTRVGYEVVIFDTAAPEAGTDAQLVSAKVGSAVLAANVNGARYTAVRSLADQLADGDVEVLGSILNEVPRHGRFRR